ncbi:MAG: MFS transporter [Alphaproteobacteria bacterium]
MRSGDFYKSRLIGGLSRNTFLLAFASLFADISSEMLYPVLPVFLTQTMHAGGSIVGLIEGIAHAAQNIVQGFSGWLSDRFGRRKSIALAGYALSALAKPLIGFSAVWHAVLAARFLDRLGSGTRSAPRDALVAASAQEAHRGKAFGLEGIGDNLGAFLGPLLAVALLAYFAFEIRDVFFFAFIPGVLAFLMVLLVRERRQSQPAGAVSDVSLRRFPRAYWKYLLVAAVFGIGNSSNAFIILLATSAGMSLSDTILVYAAFNLVAALISYPAGALSDRKGRKLVLSGAFAVFFFSYAGFALSGNLVLISLLFVLYEIYQGVFRAVGKALATDLVTEAMRASAIGYYSATVGLTGLAASVIAGLLWDHVSHAAVFYYGAATAVAGTVLLLWLVPSDARQAGNGAAGQN